MKLDKSNCYGFAIGINSPIVPGTSGGQESPVSDWSTPLLEKPTLAKAITQLKKALLCDGLINFRVSNNKVVAFVVQYKDGDLDFHLAESISGTFQHKPGHQGTTYKASSLQEMTLQLKKSDPNIKSVTKACDVWVPEVFYWESDVLGHSFSIKSK